MGTIEKIEFAARVKYHRERLGVTQREIARRIGVTPSAVNTWEKGKRAPSVNDLPVIAYVLRVTVIELFLPVPRTDG